MTQGPAPGAVELSRRRSLPFIPPVSGAAHPVRLPLPAVWERLLDGYPLPAPPGCGYVVLDREEIIDRRLHLHCARQEWILSLDGMLLFRTQAEPDEAAMRWAAGAAAHLLYTCLSTVRELAFRPVAGWTGTLDGLTTLHALGFRAQESEGQTHVGQ